MQDRQYSQTSRLFHWGMAVLILSTLPAGYLMVQPWVGRGLSTTLFLYHKNIGVVLILLVLARLFWRWRHPAPPLPASMPAGQVRIAHLTHGLLYLLMIVVPVAGYVRVRAGGFPIEMLDPMNLPGIVPRSDALAAVAKSVHYYSGVAIAVVLALHVGAALYHRIRLRDGVFDRMWPPLGR